MRGIVKIYSAAGFYVFAQLCLFRASVASFRGQASVLKFYKIYAQPRILRYVRRQIVRLKAFYLGDTLFVSR
nr:hypothetical protein [uncultured Campylobacter sp.]